MKLIRDLHNKMNCLSGSVVTIGNFDGLHCGHQTLIQKIKELGCRLNLPTVVVSFEPRPKDFFAKRKGDDLPPRLMSFREKWSILLQYNIDYFVCLRFTSELAQQMPEDFINEVLITGLKARWVVVGDDFRFGAKKLGDYTFLSAYATQHNFNTLQMPTVYYNDSRVSTTRIRELLKIGDIDLANKLLTRPYFLSGKVVHGKGRGKTLGFPTANIQLHRQHLPICGIFIVQVLGLSEKSLPGVASIGTRPTFGENSLTEEVDHRLFFWQKNLLVLAQN